MKSLGIIPARGGSKGLPRKNVRMLGGKPLIAHTIEAAVASRLDRVILSTDDDEIAEVGRQGGVEVPFMRPAELAGDDTPSLAVLLHALHFVEEHEHFHPDAAVFLQPTSPFRTAKHIDEALGLFANSDATSVLGVTAVSEVHPYFMFEVGQGGKLRPFIRIKDRPLRRQDLPVYYRINGALYITRRQYFRGILPQSAIFDFDDSIAYIMDSVSSVDINDYLDFQRAELLLRQKNL
jgi:CMP-N-acetylneuraminic acid synthetase